MNFSHCLAFMLVLSAESTFGAVVTNVLSDPGFEGLATGEPNSSTAPWYADEANTWDVVRNGNIVYRGDYSVRFSYFGNTPSIRQELPSSFTISSNASYEVRFFMRLDESAEASNPAHTNYPAKVQVDIDVADVHGGTYTKRLTKWGSYPSAADIWEEQVVYISGSELADYHGQFLRLSLRKTTADSSHRVFIDDVVFGIQETVSANTYYIDPVGGSDLNSGTSTNEAWQTLARASTDFPQNYNAGDHIQLKRGSIHYGKLYLNDSGSALDPLVIGGYGAGAEPVIDGGGYFAGIHLEDCRYILVQNLEITGDSTNTVDGTNSGDQYGVYVNATWGNVGEYITLTNLHIRDIYPETASDHEGANPTTYVGTAISFQGSGNNSANHPVSDVVVTDCTISNVGFKAISMNRSNRILLENNMMWDIGGPALQPGRCSNVVVRGNTVDKSGSFSDPRMHGRGSGIWPWTCDDVLIEENIFMHARGRADSCGVHIDFGNRDVIVQRNLSIDNAGGFLEILGNNSNCTYRYNISVDDGTRVKGVVDQGTIPNNQDGHIFWLSGFVGSGNDPSGPYNSYIYNNTIYVNTNITSTFSFQEWSDGVLIANNIFHVDGATTNITGDFADDYTPEMIAGVFWTNNLYTRSGIIPPGFPFEEVDQTIGDPRFAQAGGFNAVDYIPDSSIYVADKGIVVTNIPGDVMGIVGGLEMTEDFFGNPITGAPDMGAIEMDLPVEQDGILAGWNHFSPNNNVVNDYVDDSTPDVALAGISGLVGGEVNPAFSATGGGSRSAAAYDQGGITFGGLAGTGSFDAEASGVQLQRDYNGTAHRERLDFKVTNNTGVDVEVSGIHFDIKTNYKGGGTVTNFGTVKVIHFTPVSDLADAFSWRELASSNLYNFAWQQLDYATDAMADTTLAEGESAAFRIEIEWSDPAAVGDPTWYVDNVAFSGSVLTNELSTYAGWSAVYGLVEGEQGDDDDDGLLNLYEYGLGGNPTNGIVDGHLPTFGKSGDQMSFRHVVRNDDTNLVYYLELTDDLMSNIWTNGGYVVTGTNASFGGDFDEVTNSIPATDSNTFIRLIIEN